MFGKNAAQSVIGFVAYAALVATVGVVIVGSVAPTFI